MKCEAGTSVEVEVEYPGDPEASANHCFWSLGNTRVPEEGFATFLVPPRELELGTSWSGVMCYDSWATWPRLGPWERRLLLAKKTTTQVSVYPPQHCRHRHGRDASGQKQHL